MEIRKILHKIQKELKAPKNQYNNFGKYNYRNCEDILEAVKKLLDGAVLTLDDEVVQIGDRLYVKATATLSLGINDQISTTAYAREPLTKKGMDEAQITGATSSYARKYALNGLFCIDDTKDADSMDNTQKTSQKPNYPQKTTNQTNDDDKPWINDELFADAIKKCVEAGTININTDPSEVTKILRMKYKVAKKYNDIVKVEIQKNIK